MKPEIIEHILMHPDFPELVEYIETHFANSTEIQSIDVTNPASTIVGEVIASQKVDASLTSLKKAFETLKKGYGKTKVTYE